MIRAETRIELDGGLDRFTGGTEPPDKQGRRQHPSGDIADHCLGEGQFAAAAGRPRGAKCCGVVPVGPINHGGIGTWTHVEPAGCGPTDETPEHGLTVEVGDAHPVNGSGRVHESSRPGIADHSEIFDRASGQALGFAVGLHVS